MPITQALIIAAGAGSRIRNKADDLPKPLRKVAGLRLIERAILNAKKANINRFVIVVGYQKDKIINYFKTKDFGVTVDFVENPDWQKPNGHSVLAAKDHLKENFVLMMSDHVFQHQTLSALINHPLGENKALLAIDKKLGSIFDPDDATKVVCDANGQIKEISKQLQDYNAVDTGLFVITPDFFKILEAKAQNGEVSLSDGIQSLAAQNQMGSFDIGDGFWQDVDTPATIKHAEKKLLQLCRKDTDGFISRNLNRHVSLAITSVLMKTGLSANQVTAMTTIVGILSGYFVSMGTYGYGVLGGFLFKMASILDGCDGELSKLKLTDSKIGQWLDTLSDNFTYVCFIVGIVIACYRQGAPYIMITGGLTLFGLAMTLVVMFSYIIKKTDSGSLLAVQKDFKQTDGGLIKKIFQSIHFVIKRDFFALLFFILTILDQVQLIMILVLLASNLAWMVLLKTMSQTGSKTSHL